ncbi:hypothetical protein GOP47_0021620 [Adiantum capillus-veneris]|uniref:Pyruvate kinase n=1 Tax=Adiantum capillus-veneris TaxID=13818 RepID=A0A9D4U7U7_ADICA|nr:hypothetical protein GOP47_0021620 [Adiantum capillus-veneris]
MELALQSAHSMISPSWSVRPRVNAAAAQLNTHHGLKKGMQSGLQHARHDDCQRYKERSILGACCAKQKKGAQGDALTVVTEGLESDGPISNGAPHQQVHRDSLIVEEGKPEATSLLEIDSVTEEELKEKGLRGTRRTKLVCTIGPACCSPAQLEAMAKGGMNVARINMCHGTKEWHAQVIRNIRNLNAEKGYNVAIMMDTEGSEVHMGDLGGASFKTEDGEVWTFTVRKLKGPLPARTIHVNYEGFAEDVITGDELVVDGGMVRFEVIDKVGPDVHCRCSDPGLLLPRANLTFWRAGQVIREGNSMLPTVSAKDWIDIDFGIAEKVDFIAISFVRTAEVVKHLKSYIAARSPRRQIGVIAKIESCESLSNLEDIIIVSDGAMVGRSDLGAQIPLEQVPAVQQEVVHLCRELNKPVIVASQLLESMIEYPTPTRAEVADVSEIVRQGVDAMMLSGESAMGQFPEKALGVLRTVSLRMEEWCQQEKLVDATSLQQLANTLPGQISEEICNAATLMANKLEAEAIFVYTKGGYMASLLSRNRPDCLIFAFTDSKEVKTTLNMRWGLIPIALNFSEDMEGNLERTFSLLKMRGLMKGGDLIVAVSDLPCSNHSNMLQSIQVRRVP